MFQTVREKKGRTERVTILFTLEEVKMLDAEQDRMDWSTRADTIRYLMNKGLEAEEKANA